MYKIPTYAIQSTYLCMFLFSLSNRLVGLEQNLQEICIVQGMNVKQLVDLVNENEGILNEMKSNLRSTFVSAMTAVILRSDSTYIILTL